VITNCIISDNVTIEDKCTLSDCVILPDTVVTTKRDLSNCNIPEEEKELF
jgi:ADP-glucose pyrophosphorylase